MITEIKRCLSLTFFNLDGWLQGLKNTVLLLFTFVFMTDTICSKVILSVSSIFFSTVLNLRQNTFRYSTFLQQKQLFTVYKRV